MLLKLVRYYIGGVVSQCVHVPDVVSTNHIICVVSIYFCFSSWAQGRVTRALCACVTAAHAYEPYD